MWFEEIFGQKPLFKVMSRLSKKRSNKIRLLAAASIVEKASPLLRIWVVKTKLGNTREGQKTIHTMQ
jgi:hypothetical protein